MATDVLHALVRANLAGGLVALLLLAVRDRLRPMIGPGAVYALWLAVLAAALASLIPPRTVVVVVRAAGGHVIAARIGQPIAPPSFLAAHGPAILTSAWLTGAAAAFLGLVWRQHRFLKSLAVRPAGPRIVRAATALAGPAVVGVFSPRILLPADFATRFTPREQAVILAHETVHLSRGDSRINAVALLLQCLSWFNPVAHLAAQGMRLDQELSCDAVVMARFPKARRAYGEAMLKSQIEAIAVPAGCSWQPRSEPALARRLVMLGAVSLSPGRLAGGLALAGLAVVVAGAAAWGVQPARRLITFATLPPTLTAASAQTADATAAPVPRVLPASPSRTGERARKVAEIRQPAAAPLPPAPQQAADPRTLLADDSDMPAGGMLMEPEAIDDFLDSMPPEIRMAADAARAGGRMTTAYRGGGAYQLKSDMAQVGDGFQVSAELYKDAAVVGTGSATISKPSETAYVSLSNGLVGIIAPGKTAYVVSSRLLNVQTAPTAG